MQRTPHRSQVDAAVGDGVAVVLAKGRDARRTSVPARHYEGPLERLPENLHHIHLFTNPSQ